MIEKKEVDNVEVRAAKVEKHLDWVITTISDMRRRDIDDQVLSDDERLLIIAMQFKLRAVLPMARKLSASLSKG